MTVMQPAIFRTRVRLSRHVHAACRAFTGASVLPARGGAAGRRRSHTTFPQNSCGSGVSLPHSSRNCVRCRSLCTRRKGLQTDGVLPDASINHRRSSRSHPDDITPGASTAAAAAQAASGAADEVTQRHGDSASLGPSLVFLAFSLSLCRRRCAEAHSARASLLLPLIPSISWSAEDQRAPALVPFAALACCTGGFCLR